MISCNKKLDMTRKKFLKHFSNGISHNLILWIISKGPIHGYGIMKRLDEFFNINDDLKTKPSKIYPILKKMEKSNLISGEWKVNENNKQVKYYSITNEGELLLEDIRRRMINITNTPSWIEFYEDMTGVVINEKRN